MNILELFKKETLPALKEKLGVKNINAVPTIDKVIVSIGIGSLATRKSVKDFEEFEKNLKKITGQKPTLIKSRKSISNFKLREGMPVMLKVTLRRERAYDFLDRFVKVVLPRVRDFSGLSGKSFDHKGNYSIGLVNYNIFPELNVDDASTPMGLQITVVTKGDSDSAKSKALLESLGLIFK
ncbi:TPA: 50S ribosomal protein L5 [Patescibacteria group bacterium]|nr:50S ribosomal protein L5 [Candidatus Gracilibacteria bacterium]